MRCGIPVWDNWQAAIHLLTDSRKRNVILIKQGSSLQKRAYRNYDSIQKAFLFEKLSLVTKDRQCHIDRVHRKQKEKHYAVWQAVISPEASA